MAKPELGFFSFETAWRTLRGLQRRSGEPGGDLARVTGARAVGQAG
jgi:hypothetical protein